MAYCFSTVFPEFISFFTYTASVIKECVHTTYSFLIAEMNMSDNLITAFLVSGFLCGSAVKNPSANAGDAGSICGSN